MPYDDFVTYFMEVGVALYQDYKYSKVNVKIKTRNTYYRVNNPTDQYLYITGDMYSERNFPRGKCAKTDGKNDVVLYLLFENGGWVTKYGYIG